MPPAESAGGWRLSGGPEAVRALGFDVDELARMHTRQMLIHGGESWSIVVIRHGVLVREDYTFNLLVPSRFDIWSCTKTFTGTAWGILVDDSGKAPLPDGRKVDCDGPVHDYIRPGQPLTDPRKAAITIEQLLSMTSGIGGENAGLIGMPTASDVGPFEHALG